MARVTATEVSAIIDVEPERDLAPFIDLATLLVDETLAASGLSAARLKQIELYLAAHYAAVTVERGSLSVSKAGDALETYKGNFTSGLNLTRYGQTALNLDTTGTLNALSNTAKSAQFRIV
jgi:hypothetical protein